MVDLFEGGEDAGGGGVVKSDGLAYASDLPYIAAVYNGDDPGSIPE